MLGELPAWDEAAQSSFWLFVRLASIRRWSRGMLEGDGLPGDRMGSGLGRLGGDDWAMPKWAWWGDWG